MGVVGNAVTDAATVLADALQRSLESLAAAVAGAAPGWLALGVLLHVANQIARGRGWFAILRSACPGEPRLRRRDAIAVWVAGAGAGGVLSVRGGDAVRILLLSRRLPETRNSVLAGTLVAEAAGDTAVGVAIVLLAVFAGTAPAFGFPGAETAAWIAGGLAVLLLAAGLARHLHGGGALGGPGHRTARLRAVATGVGRGCAPLGQPGAFACRVLPWQVTSRVLRGAALACFLAAFHLPATAAAVLLVMLAQSGGRLLPLAPASVGAAVAMLAAGFGPATGATVSAGALAAFVVGMSTVLTLAGVLLAAGVVCAIAGPRGLTAVLRVGRASRPALRES